MAVPIFTATDTPKHILDATGAWLAERFDGFRWLKSKGHLERRSETQTHRLVLQPKRANSTGTRTHVQPRLTILDDRLSDWRRVHGARHAHLDPDQAPPMVFNTLFVNLVPSLSTVQLFGPTLTTPEPATLSPVERDLSGFADYLDETALPTLESAAVPAHFVNRLPPTWWRMIDASTVEWALACDDRPSAGALVRGAMAMPLKASQTAEQRLGQFIEGWELARGGQSVTMSTSSIAQLGWVSATHDLAEPSDLEVAISP